MIEYGVDPHLEEHLLKTYGTLQGRFVHLFHVLLRENFDTMSCIDLQKIVTEVLEGRRDL